MPFVYYVLVIAIILLASLRSIERFLYKKAEEQRKTKEIGTHAHSLVMDIGNILENSRGIDQIEKLKPKLEQVKKYHRNNDNRNVVSIENSQPEENKRVQLKVV